MLAQQAKEIRVDAADFIRGGLVGYIRRMVVKEHNPQGGAGLHIGCFLRGEVGEEGAQAGHGVVLEQGHVFRVFPLQGLGG